MTPKRLLLFDIDGTLIDSGGAGITALRDVLRNSGASPPISTDIEIAGQTDRSHRAPDFAQPTNSTESEENVANFLDLYLEGWSANCRAREGRVLPGIERIAVAVAAKPAANVLALLTGNIERGAELKLRALRALAILRVRRLCR